MKTKNLNDFQRNLIRNCLNINNKKPTQTTNLYLSLWISRQSKNFINKINIMKNDEIYDLWNNFSSKNLILKKNVTYVAFGNLSNLKI